VTGDDGSDTTFGGGGGDGTTTQAPEGQTGTDDPQRSGEDSTAERVNDRLDGDADRGVSVTRPGDVGSGGQLERSEQAREAAQPEREALTGGLEEQFGALSGAEGPRASAVQQLQGRIDRQTPVDAFLEPDTYNIVEEGDGTLGVEFASGVGSGEPQRRRERRQQIARDIASERDGVSPEDVAVTSTAAGFQAVVGGRSPRGPDAVITGGPDRERLETEVRVSDSADRGVGVTSGPAGGEIVRPSMSAAEAGRIGQQQLDAQRSPSRGDVRASVNRFGRVQLQQGRVVNPDSERPLVEPPDATAGELVTGQAGGRRLEQGLINEALARAGLEEQLGFRRQTEETIDPDPRGDAVLPFLRGAGRRRQFAVEAETAGDAIRQQVSDRDVQAAAAAGLVSPEPSSTLGGAAVLGTAAAIGAAEAGGFDTGQPRASLTTTQRNELDVPTEQERSELTVPEQADGGELDVPQESQQAELETPQRRDAFTEELDPSEQGQPTEVPIPTGGEQVDIDDQRQRDGSVVPGDFPLAGRDIPADPSREYVPGERNEAPTAGAAPTGQAIQEPEVEEEDGDDDLGVPEDPFRVSDRRLFDPQREFGEREDVATVPDEATPDEIDDVGSGIAGTGTGFQPARGDTVAENFERYLEERREREEQAQRQEVLAGGQTPTGVEEPLSRGDEAADTSIARGAILGTGFRAASRGRGATRSGVASGFGRRSDRTPTDGARDRPDSRERSNQDASQPPALDTPRTFRQPRAQDLGQSQQTRVTQPRLQTEQALEQPTVQQRLVPQLAQPPEQLFEYPDVVPPATGFATPPTTTAPPLQPRIPSADTSRDSDRDERRFGIEDEVFDTGVVQELDNVFDDANGFGDDLDELF
jgi:hypothetical protein